MTASETEPFIESLGIDPGLMRQQLDEFASPRLCLANGPSHQLFADTPAAQRRRNTNILDERSRSALRAQARQDAELQASDRAAVAAFCNHQPDIWVMREFIEGLVIRLRQWVLDTLAATAERIIGQHYHDRDDVLAARRP